MFSCFAGVNGIMGFFYCKGTWESKVKNLTDKVQNTAFAIPDEDVQIIINRFYKQIDSCRQKDTVADQLFCAKYVILESSNNFYKTYDCGELLLRISQLRSSDK
jgi:hypothetical protein